MRHNDDYNTLDGLLELYPLLDKLIMNASGWKRSDFTRTQRRVFLVLGRKDIINMGRLADKLDISKEQATRAVAPLVESGYIERFTDDSNRTRVLLRMTDDGRKVMGRRLDHLHEELQKLLDELSDREYRDFDNALCVVSDTFRLMAEKVQG